ncbi:GNAT family N-acetyltransferase [Streptomyces sp. NRRL S-350]|uniref:GNAT family N-acetyltransferase n=1 Tax=Streptomyces sp. NRRL S-350 TaxID=1463902 RepID=UPI0004BEE0EB|nr:GNAT family N-acetyltransferase [Streptomyces sp. NRRL S-350]
MPDPRIGLVHELDDPLCDELAALAQPCIAGFSDDRPVSPSLVRSRLANALTGEPPVLAVARDRQEMVGWCAVRRPEPGETRARLWGPVVAPSIRRTGLGTALLDTVVGAARWPLVTTDVPADRDGAADFFIRSDWTQLDPITVLHGIPAEGAFDAVTAEGVEDLDAYVAASAQQLGRHGQEFARATLRRWRDDARFQTRNLLLDPATGSLLLGLAQRNEVGSELLLAEVWAATPEVRRRLITAAHTAAAVQRLAGVRAVTQQDPADFVACGMRVTGRCATFSLDRDC